MSIRDSLLNFYDLFYYTNDYLKQSHKSHSDISQLKVEWAKKFLNKLHVDLQVSGAPSPSRSTLFVGNHLSYLDIPLLMSCVPGVSFVAKSEISSWPIIGSCAKKIETVFVERNSGSSRNSVKQTISSSILAGKRIALFPSGTTCINESKEWRRGAFEIANSTQCDVVPFRLNYSPKRTVAYIDKDFLPLHLFRLLHQERIVASIEFHDPVKITDPVTDCLYWWNWAKEGLKG